MIGLDTNVLARYYIADETDAEAARQRASAQRLLDSGQPVMVCKTVILELEWVMRGYYGFSPEEVASVFHHLLARAHVVVEDREGVERAVSVCLDGFDFADALHHASYASCSTVASFDDKKFAGRAKRMGLTPAVVVPAQAR